MEVAVSVMDEIPKYEGMQRFEEWGQWVEEITDRGKNNKQGEEEG